MESDHHGLVSSTSSAAQRKQSGDEEEVEVRRGPWTLEEDLLLMNYIESHGEGRWNSLARSSGLKRTGKSCRLRWLNYLRPDVRRGNITPEEQLLILELHSRWGNRWSKIAQHLPGRTDNEIKNYWRTRVQKHARQLQCDVNSAKFRDVMRHLWMPRLLERIRAASGSCPSTHAAPSVLPDCPTAEPGQPKPCPETSSSDSVATAFSSPPVSDSLADCYSISNSFQCGEISSGDGIFNGYGYQGLLDFDQGGWGGDMGGNLWNVEDIWF